MELENLCLAQTLSASRSAYYADTISQFIVANPLEILGKLAQHHAHDLDPLQKNAWLQEIEILKRELNGLEEGALFLEFIIPRMGKRADCVLLIGSTIYVIEFKVGGSASESAAIDQVYDYALDLKNFHRGSHALAIVPILIITSLSSHTIAICSADDGVAEPIRLGAQDLGEELRKGAKPIEPLTVNPIEWAESGYLPTPTIIEAAQALYDRHDVRDIARSDSGAKNLQATTACIDNVIAGAKGKGRKAICFITGVPGAGKTLAGLNIATLRAREHADEHAVFLSGNGPLVDVLREALARDKVARYNTSKAEALREVKTFIQNIHHFRDEYFKDINPPYEKVVIFDEAQRAWSSEQASKFMAAKWGASGFSMSEPEFLISVMDRHKDWCCIICLIGGGQEINTGEAGLLEWLQALSGKYRDWEIHASDILSDKHYTIDQAARELLAAPSVVKHRDLHLAVSMRSFRAEKLAGFVAQVLEGNTTTAAEMFSEIRDRYPIVRTRDLGAARKWLRSKARGTERYGLVASSGALRLRPEGIHIKADVDPRSWFLNDRRDVRSSYYLEEVATEFSVQGLELDWVGIAWDADLRYEKGKWGYYSFRGTRWQTVNSQDRKRYLVNAYRVLLTRARQGMVIFVPKGDPSDPTRPSSFYDATYAFLGECGVPELHHADM